MGSEEQDGGQSGAAEPLQDTEAPSGEAEASSEGRDKPHSIAAEPKPATEARLGDTEAGVRGQPVPQGAAGKAESATQATQGNAEAAESGATHTPQSDAAEVSMPAQGGPPVAQDGTTEAVVQGEASRGAELERMGVTTAPQGANGGTRGHVPEATGLVAPDAESRGVPRPSGADEAPKATHSGGMEAGRPDEVPQASPSGGRAVAGGGGEVAGGGEEVAGVGGEVADNELSASTREKRQQEAIRVARCAALARQRTRQEVEKWWAERWVPAILAGRNLDYHQAPGHSPLPSVSPT